MVHTRSCTAGKRKHPSPQRRNVRRKPDPKQKFLNACKKLDVRPTDVGLRLPVHTSVTDVGNLLSFPESYKPEWRHLDMGNIKSPTPATVILLLQKLPHLLRLDVPCESLTPKVVDQMSKTQISVLHLHGNLANKEWLWKCLNIEELQLGGNPKAEEVVAVGNLKTLKSLTIYNGGNISSLSFTQQLPLLKKLDICGLDIRGCTQEHVIPPLPNLKELTLTGIWDKKPSDMFKEEYPALEELTLGGFEAHNELEFWAEKFPNVQYLGLKCCYNVGIAAIARMPRLKQLLLDVCTFDDVSLLRSSTTLQHLSLDDYPELDDEKLRGVLESTSLSRLDLWDCPCISQELVKEIEDRLRSTQ